MNRKLLHGGESGIVLIICMILLLMLAIIGAASIFTSNTEMDISGNEQYSTSAFYLADAGAEKALAALNDSVQWRAGFANQPLGKGTFDVVVYDSTALSYLEDRVLLRSTGKIGDVKSIIEVTCTPIYNTRFEYAVFGREIMDMNGGGMIDSYDSDLGSYASQAVNGPDSNHFMYAGNYARIGSEGVVRLDGNAQAHGDAITIPSGGFNFGGGSYLYGDTLRWPRFGVPDSIPASEVADAQAVNAASTQMTLMGGAVYNAATGTLNVGSGQTAVLNSGTYFFTSVTMKGSMQIAPGAEVRIYVSGTWDSSGGNVVNQDGIPANLRLFSTGTDIKISGGSQVCAAIFAPYAEVTVTGGSEFFGAAVARQYYNGGGTSFHFDEALLRLDENFVRGYKKMKWTEL
jgi:hypothetical protein